MRERCGTSGRQQVNLRRHLDPREVGTDAAPPTHRRADQGHRVRDSAPPDWLHEARCWYYSRIHSRAPHVVTVHSVPVDEEMSDERPGALILRLQPRFRATEVIDADGRAQGVIRPEGILRGLQFAMRRDGAVVWVSTVRSIVRKRHRLWVANREVWMFDTPFYWWQHLTGTTGGRRTLVGRVGPTTRFWGFEVEPGRDTLDVLAAVAFMHWKWWRW